MISILCPTRKRPKELRRMLDSMHETVTGVTPQVVCYVDEDDTSYNAPTGWSDVEFVRGPRIVLTECWNRCLPVAKGDIFMQGNDDIVFRTNGWDQMVENEFARVPDRIVMVHGSDWGMHYDAFAAHPFVHRRWVETLGYFIPPYFSSDYGDKWVNDLANAIDRRRYLPFVVEHLHFMFKKAKIDETTRERLERHERDNVDEIWNNTKMQRIEDTMKLAALIGFNFKAPAFKDHRRLALVCPYCNSTATVRSYNGGHCNACAKNFNPSATKEVYA